VPLNIAWPSHVAALNDREHMRWSEQRRLVHSKETQRGYIASANEYFVLLDLQRAESLVTSVGSMSCVIDRDNRVVNMGIMVIPGECNKGYGKEAWTAVMNYWLTGGGMVRVEAGMMADNFAMRDLCSSTGMEYDGTKLSYFQINDNSRQDMVMFGKVR